MKTNLIQELNDQKYLSCIKIQENDGVLNIYICGTVLCPLDLDSPECDQDVLTVLDENTREIRTDNRKLYQITFDRYISYQVLNESYSAWDKKESFTMGNLFRRYTKSNYLDYITQTTYATEFTEQVTHYGILCLNHIIDVISEDVPVITKHSL